MHLKKSIQIAEVLCSHFNVEDGIHKIPSILCFIISRKVKTQQKCKLFPPKTKICAVHRDGAVTNRTCQKRFMEFCAGDFSLDHAPWPGKPGEGDSDRIETFIENNQSYTTWETANILKISKSIM